jgi:hypothetical protein
VLYTHPREQIVQIRTPMLQLEAGEKQGVRMKSTGGNSMETTTQLHAHVCSPDHIGTYWLYSFLCCVMPGHYTLWTERSPQVQCVMPWSQDIIRCNDRGRPVQHCVLLVQWETMNSNFSHMVHFTKQNACLQGH